MSGQCNITNPSHLVWFWYFYIHTAEKFPNFADKSKVLRTFGSLIGQWFLLLFYNFCLSVHQINIYSTFKPRKSRMLNASLISSQFEAFLFLHFLRRRFNTFCIRSIMKKIVCIYLPNVNRPHELLKPY